MPGCLFPHDDLKNSRGNNFVNQCLAKARSVGAFNNTVGLLLFFGGLGNDVKTFLMFNLDFYEADVVILGNELISRATSQGGMARDVLKNINQFKAQMPQFVSGIFREVGR